MNPSLYWSKPNCLSEPFRSRIHLNWVEMKIQFKLIRAQTISNHSAPIRIAFLIYFAASQLKIISSQPKPTLAFWLIQINYSDWFETLLPSKILGGKTSHNKLKWFRNLFPNHFESFWTNPKYVLDLLQCKSVENHYESFRTTFFILINSNYHELGLNWIKNMFGLIRIKVTVWTKMKPIYFKPIFPGKILERNLS